MGYTAGYADGCSIPSGGLQTLHSFVAESDCRQLPPRGLHGCNRLWSWDLEDSEWTFASTNQIWLVVLNCFYVHSYLGKISNLTSIFQMG